MYKTITFLLFLLPVLAIGQSTISVSDAIDLAIKNSLTAQSSRLKMQRAQEEYQLLNKEYLPTLRLLTSVPVISKTTSRITIPSGEDVFVNQNQVFNDLSLSMNIREPLLNGNLEITSRLNRIDILGELPSTSYYSTPFSINYSNDDLFFDDFKWQRRLSALNIDVTRRQLEQAYNEVASRVVQLYFDNIVSTNQLHLNELQQEGLAQALSVARERFRLGTVDRSEILSLEVELLEITNDVQQNRVVYTADRQALEMLIGTTAFTLDTNLANLAPQFVDPRLEYQSLYPNTLEYLQNEQEWINLEYEQSKMKSEDLFSLSISGGFGLSNTSDGLTSSFQNLVDQQLYSITFGMTLFDFGKRKDKIRITELKQETLSLQTQDQRQNFELDVQALINKIDNSRQLLRILEEAIQLADENYKNLLDRFRLGKVGVQIIIDARQKSIRLHQKHIETLSSYWRSLFELREKTNYDFLQQRKISH